MNVSHIPVREALRTLEERGLVTSIQSKGFFLKELSLSEVEDIFFWRGLIEDEAFSLGVPKLTDEDIELLEDLEKEMKVAVASNELLEFIALNRAFHFVPLRRTESPRVIRILNQLWDEVTLYVAVHISKHVEHLVLQERHTKLLNALRSRDPVAVNELMAAHRSNTLDMICAGLKSTQRSRTL
jgi:DNA-binding GntR family transcriptional regulator